MHLVQTLPPGCWLCSGKETEERMVVAFEYYLKPGVEVQIAVLDFRDIQCH